MYGGLTTAQLHSEQTTNSNIGEGSLGRKLPDNALSADPLKHDSLPKSDSDKQLSSTSNPGNAPDHKNIMCDANPGLGDFAESNGLHMPALAALLYRVNLENQPQNHSDTVAC